MDLQDKRADSFFRETTLVCGVSPVRQSDYLRRNYTQIFYISTKCKTKKKGFPPNFYLQQQYYETYEALHTRERDPWQPIYRSALSPVSLFSVIRHHIKYDALINHDPSSLNNDDKYDAAMLFVVPVLTFFTVVLQGRFLVFIAFSDSFELPYNAFNDVSSAIQPVRRHLKISLGRPRLNWIFSWASYSTFANFAQILQT